MAQYALNVLDVLRLNSGCSTKNKNKKERRSPQDTSNMFNTVNGIHVYLFLWFVFFYHKIPQNTADFDIFNAKWKGRNWYIENFAGSGKIVIKGEKI